MQETFIKRYEAFDPEFCTRIMQAFDYLNKRDCTISRNDVHKKDSQHEFNNLGGIDEADMRNMDIRGDGAGDIQFFFKVLGEKLGEYKKDLNLTEVGKMYVTNMLVQRTDAEKFESYSTWHCENATFEVSDRALTFILYLNDDFEGGETEFRYQIHKEVPKQGTLVIWPAGLTHIHRGGMLLSGVKYIVTGWSFWAPDNL